MEQFFILVNTRRVILCFSPQTIDELFRVIQYPHIQKQAEKFNVPIEALVDKLLAVSLIVYPTKHFNTIKDDPSDNRILEVAFIANVVCIVSGDRHLLKLKQFLNIPVLTPAQFLKSVKNG